MQVKLQQNGGEAISFSTYNDVVSAAKARLEYPKMWVFMGLCASAAKTFGKGVPEFHKDIGGNRCGVAVGTLSNYRRCYEDVYLHLNLRQRKRATVTICRMVRGHKKFGTMPVRKLFDKVAPTVEYQWRLYQYMKAVAGMRRIIESRRSVLKQMESKTVVQFIDDAKVVTTAARDLMKRRWQTQQRARARRAEAQA